MEEHGVVNLSDNPSFEPLTLIKPTMQGSAVCIKLAFRQKPLKCIGHECKVKQSLLRTTARKQSVDLMFDEYADAFVQGWDALEERCKALLWAHRQWFQQQDLSKEDIDETFLPALTTSRANRNQYVLKVSLAYPRDSETPQVVIRTEDDVVVHASEITPTTRVTPLIEVQSITMTKSQFALECVLRQLLVHEDVSDQFLIPRKPRTRARLEEEPSPTTTAAATIATTPPADEPEDFNEDQATDLVERTELETAADPESAFDERVQLDEWAVPDAEQPAEELTPAVDIYRDMYAKAKEAAREAKKRALEAYLVAKNIRVAHDVALTDDFDAEIDEVTESDLDEEE